MAKKILETKTGENGEKITIIPTGIRHLAKDEDGNLTIPTKKVKENSTGVKSKTSDTKQGLIDTVTTSMKDAYGTVYKSKKGYTVLIDGKWLSVSITQHNAKPDGCEELEV